MDQHDGITQARANVQSLKQQYERACQLWKAQPSAKKQEEMHRVRREYEKAQATLRQFEPEQALTIATQRNLELERAAEQREQERHRPRGPEPHALAQVRRRGHGLDR